MTRKLSFREECRINEELEDLVTELKSTLITKRLKAVKALGKLKTPMALEPLMSVLSDRSKEVRSAVVEAIRAINPQNLADILVPVSKDRSVDVRLRIAHALSFSSTQDAIDCLTIMMRDSNESVANMAAKSLANFPNAALAVLIRQFGDKSWKIRSRSAMAVSGMGIAAVPALKAAIDDEDSNVRFWACICLGRLRDRAFTQLLLGKLQDPDIGVRIAVLRGLREIGDPTMTGKLIEALSQPSEQLRDLIYEILKDFGIHSIPFLMDSLSSDFWMGRSLAAKTLSEIGADALAPLTAALEDSDKERRYWIIHILGQMREETAYADIKKCLSDSDSEIRMAAVQALGNFGCDDSIPLLIERFIDPSWVVRKEACKAILQFKHKAVPHLLQALISSEEDVRYWSLRALGQIKPIGIHLHIIKLFKDRSWNIRKTAAEVLANYGEDVLLELTNLATESDSEIRYWVLQALGKIGAEISLPLLFRALEDPSEAIRDSAQKALAHYGTQIIDDLFALFKSDKRRLLESVVNTFQRMPETIVVPKLCHWLGKYDEHVNYWIRRALGGFGETAGKSVKPLLQSKSNEVRRQALLLLGKIGKVSDSEDIQSHLKDEFWPARIAAAEALGSLGTSSSIPYLLDALEDDDEDLALSAIKALGKIRDDQAVPGLISTLNRESWILKFHAIAILGEMKVKRAVPDLLRLLSEDLFDLKVHLIKALGEIGQTDCFNPLKERFDSEEDPEARIAYILAFGNLASTAAIPILADLMKPERPAKERQAAIRALGMLKAEESKAALISAMKDNDQQIAREAVNALQKILTPEEFRKLDDMLNAARERQEKFQHFFQEGMRFMRLGNLDEAEKALKNAARINSKAAYVYSTLGNLYYKSGKLIDATKAYIMATQIEPRDITLKLNLGMVYYRRRAFSEALDTFSKVSSLVEPKSQHGLYAEKMKDKIRQEMKKGIV